MAKTFIFQGFGGSWQFIKFLRRFTLHRGHPGLRFYDIQLNIKSEKGTDLQTIEDLRLLGCRKVLKRAPPWNAQNGKKRKNQPLLIEHHTLKSHIFLKCFMYILCISIYIYMIYMFVLRFLFRLIHVHERFSTCFFFVGWVFLHHSRLEQWTVPPAGKSMTPMGKLHRSQWWKVTP